MQKNKGFTLIELLVVIAIIGILASVVLASLSSARVKGQDANIKSNLSNARAQAELYYNELGSYNYTGVCGTTARNGTKTINGFVLAAAKSSGITSVSADSIGSATVAACNATANGWAAQVPLESSGFYCVDSNGLAVETSANALTATSDVSCQ